jgi:sporulation protein YlmC with PRC-barrel domain
MLSRKLFLSAVACTALASPAFSQATAPPAPVVTPPATTVPTMNAPGPVSDIFYQGSWMPTHWRASDAIGQAVYNKANEKVGDIEDVLIDGDGRVLAAVIGVGGFLGMGEHKVAVTYRSFQMSRDAAGKSKITVDFDKVTLKNAPQYKPTDAIKKL